MAQIDTIIGNDGFKDAVKSAMQSGRLAHCLLICGEKGTGTNYAARCIAADYLYPNDANGVNQVMNNASPEYTRYDGEGASGEIKAERMRAMRKDAFSTSLSANGRVFHISRAENLNLSSANIILKVLEEPPENIMFILTAASEATVLPTIRSRCCTYSMAPVSCDECAQYIIKNYPQNKREAAHLADIFGGKIGLCVDCIENSASRKRFDDAEKMLSLAAKGDEYTISVTLAGYEKDKESTKALLSMLMQVSAAALKAGGENADAAMRCIVASREFLSRLNANINQKLASAVFSAHAANA